ncbi:FtsB family cell division protein [Alicyclobacillus tolerans]|uniref:Cell division protein FtsB n=2 Tax=Alicyclobacillus tolerans TaxID=90970 RepID=A0ABT9LZR4_9BACL|nr:MULTISPECIES: septum formation initiator family protein [Alicyclobacillus]MDP9729760.1 cell division protein FtsB [Alicyclobacillus tengchongensis]QRF22362.1 septum formation initiator family protein [Alicyclobacillus sp. TC]SHK06675.1 Cell division protein FtsB [Alicyclobacillus montanus]
MPRQSSYASRQAAPDVAPRIFVRKPWRKFLRLRYVALCVVFAYAVIHYETVQRPILQQLEVQHQQLNNQLSQLKTQNTYLKNRVQQLNNPSFIEKYATDHFGLIVPGQIPFTVANSQH